MSLIDMNIREPSVVLYKIILEYFNNIFSKCNLLDRNNDIKIEIAVMMGHTKLGQEYSTTQ